MICAYCKQEASATREHVIPAFIYRFQKQSEASVIGWNEVAKKMVGGEHQVKDVCETCNGGVLSALDAYGKEFLNSNGFLTQNYTALSADLTYDYDQLARWLLKISFNSTRIDRGHSHLFEKFIPFILNGAPAPSKADFAIVATLAAPVPIDELNGDYEVLHSLAGLTARNVQHVHPPGGNVWPPHFLHADVPGGPACRIHCQRNQAASQGICRFDAVAAG